MNNWIYDIECYPNIFTLCIMHEDDTTASIVYEISTRRNDARVMLSRLHQLRLDSCKMVGFNNIGFDYPVLHDLIMRGGMMNPAEIYKKSNSIINSPDRFSHIIWPNKQYVKQVDLYRIHHFDNPAKSTSLKMIEFNMRLPEIQDLPFKPGSYLTHQQMDELIAYNKHDVECTRKFFIASRSEIELRIHLTKKYGKDFTNASNSKIGSSYFIMKLEERLPGSCYNPDRSLRQTPRSVIKIGDLIFPYVKFEQPEFNRILSYLKGKTITETKGVFKGLSCTVGEFPFVFGLGGIHGSVESQKVTGNIIDVDVTSYYPSLAIANKLFPEHLGPVFCEIYDDIKKERLSYPKKTPENLILKEALNAVFGNSNSKFSPFYDPDYTMGVTINGQLLLCMLADQLLKVPSVRLIQVNTDGVTYCCDTEYQYAARQVCEWWERYTCLDLEGARYSRMFIRDVNNYIAEYSDGSVKRKGVYAYGEDLGWHKNHGGQVIAKVAERALLHNGNMLENIMKHCDIMDFMFRTKVPRNSTLMWGDTEVQNISRYFVSNSGAELTKIMPPLKGKAGKREIGIEKGYNVTICNNLSQLNHFDVNYDYYLKEVHKIVKPLRG